MRSTVGDCTVRYMWCGAEIVLMRGMVQTKPKEEGSVKEELGPLLFMVLGRFHRELSVFFEDPNKLQGTVPTRLLQ